MDRSTAGLVSVLGVLSSAVTKGEALGPDYQAFGGSLVRVRHEAYCWTNWSSELTRPVGPTVIKHPQIVNNWNFCNMLINIQCKI